jgi:hypothetical protein
MNEEKKDFESMVREFITVFKKYDVMGVVAFSNMNHIGGTYMHDVGWSNINSELLSNLLAGKESNADLGKDLFYLGDLEKTAHTLYALNNLIDSVEKGLHLVRITHGALVEKLGGPEKANELTKEQKQGERKEK